jgi:superfamily II DNA/RNA helicase
MAADRLSITFDSLNVPHSIVDALAANGITIPTAIQARTLPDTLAGRDVLGRGQTGSGKTYAFLVPLVTRLVAAGRKPARGKPRAVVLVPTRELATQVEAALARIADPRALRWVAIFGGVSERPQIAALRSGVDIVIACPGRLAAHVRNGHAHLDVVEITVLDEADHMADLGFLPVVRRLLAATPRTAQRLLFSATLDNDIDALVREFLRRPVTHEVDTSATPVRLSHHALQVQQDDLLPVLTNLASAPERALVFTQTKRGAKRLAGQLVAAGVNAVELHGNLAQNARTRNLQAFADGTAATLVATDIAARGIHVDDVALVIHVQPPAEHKAYLHRSGRTARAGAVGAVVTLFTPERLGEVQDLARRAGVKTIISEVQPDSPLLADLAPGRRTLVPRPAAGQKPVELDPVSGLDGGSMSSDGPGRRLSKTVKPDHRMRTKGEPSGTSDVGRVDVTNLNGRRRRPASRQLAAVDVPAARRGSANDQAVHVTAGGAAAFSRRSRVGR